jgi:hypothetical protein
MTPEVIYSILGIAGTLAMQFITKRFPNLIPKPPVTPTPAPVPVPVPAPTDPVPAPVTPSPDQIPPAWLTYLIQIITVIIEKKLNEKHAQIEALAAHKVVTEVK